MESNSPVQQFSLGSIKASLVPTLQVYIVSFNLSSSWKSFHHLYSKKISKIFGHFHVSLIAAASL